MAPTLESSYSSSSPIECNSGIDDSDVSPSAKRARVSDGGIVGIKKPKIEGGTLPLGFLDPLPPPESAIAAPPLSMAPPPPDAGGRGFRQFWKAGDYERAPAAEATSFSAAIDHVRVHPKFLHSNATSHKWALGALAELLDNSMDEVCNGATFVNVDMLKNTKDGMQMLLVEDNGGGMDPDKMRQCMSLGFSMKSKSANTIGQYGNGFKTSTMRLGADVIVFSRCLGKGGKSSTQSIGLLSYTFLRNTGKEDIIVPMIDYEKEGEIWNRMTRSSTDVWNHNLETILNWSPYSSEADLLQQFNYMADQGTRIVIYNLWDDDEGELELDFDADKHDIQVRGCNRDEKKIQMARHFPNSRHFLTYRHSLRSYASILYLRIPSGFRMILREKEIEHHNIVNDMMLKENVTYRPQAGPDGVSKDPNMFAVMTMGFVKDAKDHIDVQGFNVYHKNRLIKPFWRVWNAAGSDGRGVIGVLEANFVEPAHDKQGFERTTVLSRLEARLVHLQKTYWANNCNKIGYAPRRNKKVINGLEDRDSSPEALPRPSSRGSEKNPSPSNISPNLSKKQDSARQKISKEASVHSNHSNAKAGYGFNGKLSIPTCVQCNGNGSISESSIQKLTDVNNILRIRLKNLEEILLKELQQERDKNKALSEQLAAKLRELEVLNEEQEAIIDIFQEERSRREKEESDLRKKVKEAYATIKHLEDRL